MYIAADIGGSKMRVCGSDDRTHFSDPIILDTPQEYGDGMLAFLSAVKQVLAGENIDYLIAGVPGVVSREGTRLLTAPHLPQWRGKAIADDLKRELGVPVHIENDTALVALGEATVGAGKGAGIVAYITVSTGVNGARVTDGVIDRVSLGFEIGGQYLFTGAADPRSLEELVSGAAISEKYSKHPKDIEKDSPIWEELARTFAYGLHNTILHWSPDRVVLGGSMFNAIGISVSRVQFHLQQIMRKLPELPDIVHSSLGDTGGLSGGMARLRQLV